MTDEVDVIVEQWRRERPDLDLAAIALLGRMGRLALLLQPAIECVFERHGLSQGEFDVLAALRRSGPPYTLTPSGLSTTLMLSRAGMTSRLDRLEAAGLVNRTMDPADRRSFRVTLTDHGYEVVDDAMTEHTANETELVASLTPEQRANLDDALRVLLSTFR
ncbi:MAG TPA: MarR family transcriptional regulator [Pseudonocardiaceae bacterium]|jgi:DNA-binding MarR family transcriptional regulator